MTTWPAELIEKYPLPQASTWYKSNDSPIFQAWLSGTNFAGVFKARTITNWRCK
jgi:hypothetical protein